MDDDPETFTVDVLLAMKTAHEKWFDSLHSPADERRESQELLMISIIDEWEERADIENWRYWVSSFLGYRLWIDNDIVDRLHGSTSGCIHGLGPMSIQRFLLLSKTCAV